MAVEEKAEPGGEELDILHVLVADADPLGCLAAVRVDLDDTEESGLDLLDRGSGKVFAAQRDALSIDGQDRPAAPWRMQVIAAA